MHETIDVIIFQAPLSIANISAIDRYLLVVTVNGTSSFNTTVAVNTTSVNTFETFPNISQRRYTTYSLRVAYISSIGQSDLTDPVSIGKHARTHHLILIDTYKLLMCMFTQLQVTIVGGNKLLCN